MNYIQKLKEENKILREGLESLRAYVTSDKFNGPELNDKMVNRNDIVLRISEIEQDLNRIEY